MQIIFIYLFVINIVTFAMFGIDKMKAQKGLWRIPEKTLMSCAVFGGSFGALAGMKVFHHKTQHRKFTMGIPAILSFQILLFIFAFLC